MIGRYNATTKAISNNGIGVWTAPLVDAHHNVYLGTASGHILGVSYSGTKLLGRGHRSDRRLLPGHDRRRHPAHRIRQRHPLRLPHLTRRPQGILFGGRKRPPAIIGG